MNPDKLPLGHIVGRRLVIVVIAAVLVIALIWFFVTAVATGDVQYWYHLFKYDQNNWFNTLFYAWKFPWE